MIVAIATNRIHSIQASGVLAWLDDFLYLPEVLYVMILVLDCDFSRVDSRVPSGQVCMADVGVLDGGPILVRS
jgi:hypothetical protein